MAASSGTALAALRKLPLFALVSDQELEQLLQILRTREVRRGQAIFHQGDPLDSIFLVLDGLVKVVVVSEDGQEQVMNILSTGDIFPHVGFIEGGLYPGTAVGLEDTRLGALLRSDLLALVRTNGDLAVALLEMLGATIRTLQERISDLGLRNLQERLAAALWRLARRAATQPGEAVTINLTHQELSSLVGASREAVSRELGSLRREGVVETVPGGLRLPDPERLLDLL